MLKNFFYYRPFADRVLCHFLKRRLTLPVISLQILFEDFAEQPITLYQLPLGGWSTPISDLAMILKLVACTKPQKLMEVGSFRGYTALYMAQHSSADATVVTIDSYPEHGEAYRDTAYAEKVERRVGETRTEIFRKDEPGSYDLIFLDADHSYTGVKHDTELLLPLVSQTGFLVWHDYANWGYFDGKNGVPEYLKELAQELPIAHIGGSDLAIYSPVWAMEKASLYKAAIQPRIHPTQVKPWETSEPRG